MDITGGEGSLRTRAKYLVPHNPETQAEVDFEFGSNTSTNSLTTLRWNTIYTVKNHIRRYERTDTPSNAHIRSFVGIKDVDSARGKYTPFPFNKLEIAKDALFNFICGLVIALSVIVAAINGTVVFIINKIIGVINIFGASLAYIPCISLQCNDTAYAPGCKQNAQGCGMLPVGSICVGSTPNNACDQTDVRCDAGYTHCVAMGLIESLNLLKFDFYNDWVNGTLYAPLFKYESKKLGDGPERFCERSCGGGGVNNSDPNNPNGFDNPCYPDTYIIDTCIPVNSCSVETAGSNRTSEGIIEKNGDTLYYSPFSKNLAVKFFATDIVSLGSSIKCHHDGTPFVQDLWIDTTYNIPPLLPEYSVTGTTTQDDLAFVTSGMDSEDSSMAFSLFIDVNCVKIQARSQQCGNIARQCELGVGLDDYLTNTQGQWIADPNAIINADDIDVRFVRNIFAWLNNDQLRTAYPNPTDPQFDCTFNTQPNCGVTIGEPDYNIFRYHNANQTWTTSETPKNKDSFYFYFGLNAASTAITKLRERYFAPCPVISNPNFTILGTVSHNTALSPAPFMGAINVTVIGGQGPYNYFWTGPNGYSETILGENGENGDIEILDGGLYTLTVVDAGGLSTTATFVVNNPQLLTCNVSGVDLSLGVNGNIIPNGQLNLVAQGGMSPYDFTWVNTDDNNTGVVNGSITGIETVLGLTAGNYQMIVTDMAGNTCTAYVELLEPQPLSFTVATTNTSCPSISNGILNVVATGGTQPYSYSIEAPNEMVMGNGNLESYSSATAYNNNLGAGLFVVYVTDSSAPPITVGAQQYTISLGVAPQIGYTFANVGGNQYSTGTDGQFDIIPLIPNPNPLNQSPLVFTFSVNGNLYSNQISPFTVGGLAHGSYDIKFTYQGCVSNTQTVEIIEWI